MNASLAVKESALSWKESSAVESPVVLYFIDKYQHTHGAMNSGLKQCHMFESPILNFHC